MGLPQLSSGHIPEEITASFSAFPQSPSHCHCMSSCDMSGMHVGHLGSRVPAEVSRETECIGMHKDGQVHRLKISATPHKAGRHVQSPVLRIVGFESKATTSPGLAFEGNQIDSTADNATESSGSLVRKRISSPLSDMVLPRKFDGETLEIGSCICTSYSLESCNKHSGTAFQEHKKANIGNSSSLSPLVWSGFPLWRTLAHEDYGTNSRYFTDGPLLKNKDQSLGVDGIEEACKLSSSISVISIPARKVVSSPLCLSPLGRNFSGRMKSNERCQIVGKEVDDKYLTLKEMELSLDKTISDILSVQREEDSGMAGKSFQNVELIQKKFDQFSHERVIALGVDWSEDSTITRQYAKLGRSLSGLHVRRSLVCSFEEIGRAHV